MQRGLAASGGGRVEGHKRHGICRVPRHYVTRSRPYVSCDPAGAFARSGSAVHSRHDDRVHRKYLRYLADMTRRGVDRHTLSTLTQINSQSRVDRQNAKILSAGRNAVDHQTDTINPSDRDFLHRATLITFRF